MAFGKVQSVEFYMRSHIAATVYLSGYNIYDEESSSDSEQNESASTKVNQFDLNVHCTMYTLNFDC